MNLPGYDNWKLAEPPREKRLRVESVVGTRGKHWMIVNGFGGLIRYFEGTKKEAEAEARDLEQSK